MNEPRQDDATEAQRVAALRQLIAQQPFDYTGWAEVVLSGNFACTD